MKILTVENLCYSVNQTPGNVVSILTDINFSLEAGSVVGMSGESGSGKTTLAKLIAGHLTPTSGRIIFNVKAVNNSNPVQLLYQNSGNIINPLRKIYQMTSEAALVNTADSNKAAVETEHLFSLLDINKELWNKRGYELSGGEQQRAALARILAVKPKLLILDEPFAAQDIKSQLNILNLLKRIKQEFNLTIICISHNSHVLNSFAESIIIIKNGRLSDQQYTGEINKS